MTFMRSMLIHYFIKVRLAKLEFGEVIVRNLFIIMILISLFGCGGGSDEPNEMNQETEPSDNTKPASEGKFAGVACQEYRYTY